MVTFCTVNSYFIFLVAIVMSQGIQAQDSQVPKIPKCPNRDKHNDTYRPTIGGYYPGKSCLVAWTLPCLVALLYIMNKQKEREREWESYSWVGNFRLSPKVTLPLDFCSRRFRRDRSLSSEARSIIGSNLCLNPLLAQWAITIIWYDVCCLDSLLQLFLSRL